ncbi:MAG: MFS transporter [Actinomycetota bacterium]|nr:MFS transporter [Actinomycetota bacterium]
MTRRLSGVHSPTPRWRTTFAALGVRSYRQWFFSQVLSASGTMTQVVALSWLVLQLTHSGVDLGLLTTAALLPLLLAGPFSGALVDRVDRRVLLMVTQSLYIALSVVMAIITATGTVKVWMVFATAFASGVVGAPDTAARQVYVNDLVGPERLNSAVSLNEVVINASRVVGPALGGLLLATEGVSACCWANALSFVPSLAVLVTHRHIARVPRAHSTQHDPRFIVGWRYAWRHPTIRLVLFLAAASGMLFNMNVPLPLLATRVFHLGAGGYGLMMSVFGIGGILGGLAAAASHALPRRSSVLILAAATGAIVIATASARNAGELYAGLAVTGCVSIWFIARANALVQFETELALRGRVMALWSMALPGCMPFLSPLVGWVGTSVGARESFALSGATMLVLTGAGSIRARSRTDSTVSDGRASDSTVSD